METKLFSKRSLKVSLKGLASYIVAQLLSILLWGITFGLVYVNKWLGVGFGIFTLIASFLFFGWLSSKWWSWS